VRVPLAGVDSDESIEVNIDIDWPRTKPNREDVPKEPAQILSSDKSEDDLPDLDQADDTPPNSDRGTHRPLAHLAGLASMSQNASLANLWYIGGNDLTLLENSKKRKEE